MKNSLVIENVAKTMDVSPEIVTGWFERITEEAIKELESGSLQLSGFGILRKEHVSTEITSNASGETLLEPPKNTVLFESVTQTDRDFISSVAVRQLKLTPIDAKKLSITYEKILNKVLDVKKQLTLEKIGTFDNTGSTVTFTPDPLLLAAINERYHYLKPVKIDIMAKPATPRPATPPLQQPTPAVAARTSPPRPATAAHNIAPPPLPLPVPPPPMQMTHEEEQMMTPEDQMTPYDDFIPPPPPIKQTPAKRVELKSQDKEIKEIMQKPIEQLRNEQPVESTPTETPKVTERKLTPQLKPKRVSDTGFDEFKNPEKTDAEKSAKRRKRLIIGAATLVVVIAGGVFYNNYSQKQAEQALALIEQQQKAKLVESEKSELPKAAEEAKPAAADKATEEPLVVKEEAKRVKTKADVPPATKPEPAAKPEPLKKPDPVKPAPVAAGGTGLTAAYDPVKGGYVIVVASRTSKAEADDIAKTYTAKGFTTSVKSADVNGTTRWRIRIGQFESRQAASAEKTKLGSKIPEDAYIDPVK
jgi:nucleoid DNA-binding protein